ncbi:tyrosine--tRNA ligase [Chelatococcus composti]|jgi:tyrosyl-tRNA synthetase|uniref:Tyrosine--tRNA ligase n=1 Tax=Chelatococcus composti TaxID=1743235 RepID=A0A841K3G0_9HYPH|nr:tyrosine--tRNA ligase [Chelatococcus composti]MBB6166865.1 tyrosyl-tRNA synthetase [Chelatococcus composti]MBS7734209.1 tyrosine--tRNA ligase [Chelatococcus composti]GGG25228.1 tyrosine--tRNA ligase [Chelatococcus composti]
MTTYRSEFLRALDERGLIHQISDAEALDDLATKERIVAYIGYDLTAPSLHVGHMTNIMMLRRLQQTGHKPIVLMGGGTTRIGDPSFRNEARPLLDDAQIAANKEGIRKVFSKFLTFGDGPTDAIMVDNAEWLDRLEYIPFLRDIGRHFTVNRMLSFESVKTRLDKEEPLSFLEFNYMILQAYDFLELSRRYGCRLQMGGSDQWGNIVNGIELARRVDSTQVFALTCPLLTTASGAKMGKSAAGAVWLNEDMLPPYGLWQYWRNCEDADVGRFLRIFTDLPLDEIARLEQLQGAELNEAKKILATEITALVHGREAAETAAETARKTFEEGALAENLPSVEVPADELKAGLGVLAAFVRAGLVASTSEARRQIKGGGLKVNDVVVSDERAILNPDQLTADGVIKLSFGKKKHVLLRAV